MPDKYQALFYKALEAGQKRDYQLSIALLTSIVSETDSIPEAFLYLGRSYHASGEFYKAVQSFKFYLNSRMNSAKGYFFLGRTYLVLGFFLKALDCFKKADRLSPGNSEILSLTGMTYFKMRKLSASLFYLEQAVLSDPDSRSIHNAYLNVLYIKGIRDFHAGNTGEAGQIFEFLQKSGKNVPSINLYLACVKKETGNISEALELYRKVIQINPDDHTLKLQIIPLLFQLGKNSEAVGIINELTQKNIQIDSNYFKNMDINRIMAVESYRKGKYKTAAFYTKKVLRENYYDNEMHLLIGESFRLTGEYNKAENHFRLVLKRAPEKVEAVYGITMTLWAQERYRDLFNELKKEMARFPEDSILSYYHVLSASRLNLDPSMMVELLDMEMKKNDPDPYLYESLGEQYLRLSRLKKAEECFKTSLSLKHDHPYAYHGLIKTYFRLGKYGKTGTVFRDYLSVFPDDDRTRKYYINHLYNTGNFRKTAKEIERFLSRHEGDEIINRLLAKSYMNTGEYKKAMILYRQMLRDDPGNSRYLLSYAYCLDRNSYPEKSIEILEKSRSYIKENADIELTIGVLYMKLNRYEQALASFRKALEMDEKDWRPYYNISRVYKKQGLRDFAAKFGSRAEQLKKNT